MDFQTIVFYFLSTVVVLASLRVITAKNPVHAALFLVLAFFSAGGIWMLLHAEFLAIALVITPWLARRLLGRLHAASSDGIAARLAPLFRRSFAPFLDRAKGARNRFFLWLGIAGLIAISLALPVLQLVVMKMLPFDNKSEFQVVVDMPAGSSLERTAVHRLEPALQIVDTYSRRFGEVLQRGGDRAAAADAADRRVQRADAGGGDTLRAGAASPHRV